MRRSAAGALAVLLLAAGCSSQAEENNASAGAPALRGMVGTEDSPNAFEISLVDKDGKPVAELPAGKYNIEVTDQTDIHDFHLTGGNGAVDEKTGVVEKVKTTWVVTLKPGQYRYMCDPHPSMHGEFTVS
jgi:plastocyanin